MPTVKIPSEIAERTKEFVGREWVVEQVVDWLEKGTEQVFLLTGEPGSGKTALAAWLAQRRKMFKREISWNACAQPGVPGIFASAGHMVNQSTPAGSRAGWPNSSLTASLTMPVLLLRPLIRNTTFIKT